VLPHKRAIEERIADVGQSLFGQSYRYLLYDLTSTYFEGQMESNPKARRGYSRDHRPDCKQVTIGAVVDREGYPTGTGLHRQLLPLALFRELRLRRLLLVRRVRHR